MEKITSFHNPKTKLIKKLREKKWRVREGLFVIDYERDLERALRTGYEVDYAFVCPETSPLPTVTHSPWEVVASEALTYEVSAELMAKVSYRQNPSRVVAVMRQKSVRTLRIIGEHILILVNLKKPGNIGALLRTADAAQFTSIWLIDMHLDIYNPNIIRSSTGACFLENVCSGTTPEAIDLLKRNHYAILSADPGGNTSLFEVNFMQNIAIALGTEDTGLNEAWVMNCDHLVKIPMAGQVADSLNVSVSGAVMMYEAYRQSLMQDKE